jgi:hypothetical protein
MKSDRADLAGIRRELALDPRFATPARAAGPGAGFAALGCAALGFEPPLFVSVSSRSSRPSSPSKRRGISSVHPRRSPTMARPEAIALAGYYPTPPAVLPSLASLLEFEPAKGGRSHVLVDPCAGEGEAIHALASRWFPRAARASCQLYAIGLEAGRYAKLKARPGFAAADVGGREDGGAVDLVDRVDRLGQGAGRAIDGDVGA